MTAEVDGHRRAFRNTQRTVAQVDVRRDGDVCIVVLYRCAQFTIRRNTGLRPGPLCDRAQEGYNKIMKLLHCFYFFVVTPGGVEPPEACVIVGFI